MKNTAAKFVSAVFASIVASSSLLASPEAKEKEKPADTCLLGPSASVPSGGHWYYRYDRVNKRNCWYLGDAKGKSARRPVAEEDTVTAEKAAAPPPKKPAAQRSVTDARAEFQPPQASVEPDSKAIATRGPAMAPVDAQRAAEEPRKVVTTRWPEPVVASPPAAAPAPPAQLQTQPPVAQPPQIAQPQAQPQPQAAPAAQPPRPAAMPVAPAKATAAADQPLSMPMLLTVLAGGLSVIGVMASAVFARGKPRVNKSRPARRLSRTAPMPPLQPAEQPRPEQPRAPDDPSQRLQQMLAEIQRRAAA